MKTLVDGTQQEIADLTIHKSVVVVKTKDKLRAKVRISIRIVNQLKHSWKLIKVLHIFLDKIQFS